MKSNRQTRGGKKKSPQNGEEGCLTPERPVESQKKGGRKDVTSSRKKNPEIQNVQNKMWVIAKRQKTIEKKD